MPTAEPRWYVAQTQVHSEAKAAGNLLRQGFEIYLPRYLKRRRHARKLDTVAVPLFSCYLFINIDMATQRWRAIQSTFGVSHLVMNGDAPAVVPEAVIGALKRREDDRGFIRMDNKPGFAPGEKIRVLAGAFMDSTGLFSEIADHDRVSILLDMLGQKVRVLLDADMVGAA